MMGGPCSKMKGGDAIPPLHANPDSLYRVDLNSYEAACRHDPDLQSFDAIVHDRTSRAINSLANGIEIRALSFGSLKEVTGCLLEMNQEVVKVILDCKKDIWNNQDLFSLVEEYFDNSRQTLEFCTALESCLKRARNSQLIIHLAVRHFEEEVELQNGIDVKRYVKTLEELKKFKETEDPFTEEFFLLLQSVQKQQISMLGKLQARKRKIDKKLKSMKMWRKISNILFIATFISVLIFSVVAAAIAAPPVVTALAGALAVPIGSVGKWCNWLLSKYENEMKGQRELMSSMHISTLITLSDIQNIRSLVSKLEIAMETMLHQADFAIREEETAVKLVIDEIKKKLEEYMEAIEALSLHSAKCNHDIRKGRTVILQRIIRHPTNSSSTNEDMLWGDLQ